MATKKASTADAATVAAKINPALSALARPVDSLKLDERNARKHERRSIDAIKTSLSTYGQQKPIVALTSGVVIAGNGTLEAARELGWDRLAVVTFDTEDEARARAFAIMDNRSAELSSWSIPELGSILDELNGLELLDQAGFQVDELLKLISSETEFVEAKGAEHRDEPPPPENFGGTAPNPRADGHVRMVQLFLTSTTQPVFMEAVKLLSKKHGTENVTDTVHAVVVEAARGPQ